jgi:hypothetical protein
MTNRPMSQSASATLSRYPGRSPADVRRNRICGFTRKARCFRMNQHWVLSGSHRTQDATQTPRSPKFEYSSTQGGTGRLRNTRIHSHLLLAYKEC